MPPALCTLGIYRPLPHTLLPCSACRTCSFATPFHTCAPLRVAHAAMLWQQQPNVHYLPAFSLTSQPAGRHLRMAACLINPSCQKMPREQTPNILAAPVFLALTLFKMLQCIFSHSGVTLNGRGVTGA